MTTPPSLVEQQEPAPGPAAAKPVAEAVGAPLAAPPGGVRTGRRPGAGRGARRSERAPDGPRARGRPVGDHRVGAEGSDHQGRPAGVPEGPGPARRRPRPRRRRRARGSRRSRRRTSPSSARSRRRRLPRIKKVSGPFLHRSWLNVPHVTHNDEADITELDAYRKQPRHGREEREEPLPGHAAGVPGQGRGGCAQAVPGVQQLADPGEGRDHPQAATTTSASPWTPRAGWSSPWSRTPTARASSS